MADGAYTFVIYDSAGDGMYDNTTQGFYKISKVAADGTQTVVGNGGTFGSSDTAEFSLP
ncbi:hypothetical protein [Flavobacterium sp. 3HN19-14]|uniref:hypothetical protein n=1 Tax=Flavobacterium sp. 3HN19-14 TaxID=3448133 RepID=UPI003EE1F897